jgi:transcriptional regulator with XRE-family HTH domain
LREAIVSKSTQPAGSQPYGRGTGVPDPADVHVGGRIRARRLLVGMNQDTLANRLGLTFQQVQKYESGANRVSASRLSQIAELLGVPVDYFFIGLGGEEGSADARERLQRPEAIELIRSYYAIGDERIRRQFLDMIKAVAEAQRR